MKTIASNVKNYDDARARILRMCLKENDIRFKKLNKDSIADHDQYLVDMKEFLLDDIRMGFNLRNITTEQYKKEFFGEKMHPTIAEIRIFMKKIQKLRLGGNQHGKHIPELAPRATLTVSN